MEDRIKAVFDGFAQPERAHLLTLRSLIFDLATEPVDESLKWGQPSYATPSGSPIRLGVPKSGGYAIYCHCATTLIGDFAALFGKDFRYEGNRAVLLDGPPDLEKLTLLITAAQSYHAKPPLVPLRPRGA